MSIQTIIQFSNVISLFFYLSIKPFIRFLSISEDDSRHSDKGLYREYKYYPYSTENEFQDFYKCVHFVVF